MSPISFSELNERFYTEEGPSDYFQVRIISLMVIAGDSSRFSDLAASANYEGIALGPFEDDESHSDSVDESNERTVERFSRIESHLLKQHVIETLLRQFLAHRGNPPCPWWEISRRTNFSDFKDEIKRLIVDSNRQTLKPDICDVFLGSNDPQLLSDEQSQLADGWLDYLKYFASDWLNDASPFNATKHGLSALPSISSVSIGRPGKNRIQFGEGVALTFLEGSWEGDDRLWRLKTQWVSQKKAIMTALVANSMLHTLWSIARRRYVGAPISNMVVFDAVAFPLRSLKELQGPGATEFAIDLFTETRPI